MEDQTEHSTSYDKLVEHWLRAKNMMERYWENLESCRGEMKDHEIKLSRSIEAHTSSKQDEIKAWEMMADYRQEAGK